MKRRLALACAVVAVLVLSLDTSPPRVAGAPEGCMDFCSMTVDINPGTYCWVVCPEGDGPPLNALSPSYGDATLLVTVKDLIGDPIPGIPASDFWVWGCSGELFLCGGSGSIDATGPTDANGQTTIEGALAGGGCEEVGLAVVVQGVIIMDPDCLAPLCLDIKVRSPDGDADGDVDLVDFSQFGDAWVPLGGVYDACMDFDCNGVINIIDYTVFGNHWQDVCF